MTRDYVPLPHEMRTDIWRNVKKLGSEIIQIVDFNIPTPLASGTSWESEIIDTTGWITVEFYVFSDKLLEMQILFSNDGTTFDESSVIYIPPNEPLHVRWVIITRYFKIRVTNISGLDANTIRIRATFRPYLGEQIIVPKRVTLYTFSSTLSKGTVIQSPVFDTGLAEEGIFTIYPARAFLLLFVEGSPDGTTWYPIYRNIYFPTVAALEKINPPLKYIRFRFRVSRTSYVSLSFSLINKF